MRLPTEPLASFSIEKTMISNGAFKSRFDQLPQTKEEVVLKT